MLVAIVYVFPMVQVQRYYPLAHRFASTWKQHPPGAEPCSLHVIGNGGQVPQHDRQPFDGIPNVHWQAYNNMGWDIGAFQWAAEAIPCDLLVCMGAPIHFHHTGWLDRMVDSYINNGPALYGCWAYLSPNWHVRTTCFWLHPALLKSYPYTIGSTRQMRYEFEHGNHSLTRHVMSAGMECWMVTTGGCFPFSQWQDRAPGVDNSLVLDQHIHR